ncbi:MAG: prolyl aminopeptidase [Gammaproteobacteria bacterium]|nr:prolyl aminopeptidase [Gammaproteobacteria bacterium]
MIDLFPVIKPFAKHRIEVDTVHTLHVEECGTAGKIPVVFLHGGPGGGCYPDHRRYFDPQRYHIILFDQRGCGQSTPHAILDNNTTWDLVSDLELIRNKLNIEQWVVFGGSWGSTLALAYAQKHPENILRLVLRGIFLCRKQDIDWFYQSGTSRLFPEAWGEYLKPITDNERHQMVEAYYKRLTSDNELVRMAAAKAWSLWEASTATFKQSKSLQESFSNPYFALSFARIECHYFINGCFFEENELLNNMDKIANIDGYIVHGRYDAICPVDQATALKNAWPKAQLSIIEDAGHALSEPGITQRLLTIMQQIADELH